MAAVAADSTEYAPGQLLVRIAHRDTSMRDSAGTALVQAAAVDLHRMVGGTVRESYVSGWQLVELPDSVSVASGLRAYGAALDRYLTALRSDQGKSVEARAFLGGLSIEAEPDYLVELPDEEALDVEDKEGDLGAALRLLRVPNDTLFPRMGRYGRIDAARAWDRTVGSRQIVVAVLDNGVDITHEDLAANIWDGPNGIRGYDKCTGSNNPMPSGSRSHGTHVAGIVGAIGNNRRGGVGVNWTVTILPVRMICPRAKGLADAAPGSYVLSAYDWVIRQRQSGVNVRVINGSWKNVHRGTAYESQRAQIAEAGRHGIMSVFAAGNQNANIDTDPTYPASYDLASIVAVANATSQDRRSPRSSYGRTRVHLAAPGSHILSTLPNDRYGTKSGTSMAAPMVAGAAALLLAADPTLTTAQVKARLMSTVDTSAHWRQLVASGGRLNIGTLLATVPGNGTPTPTPTPTPNPGPLPQPANQPLMAFVSTRDGVRQIYVMDADASTVRPLTSGKAANYDPVWTADGRILFVSERDGRPAIYIMEATGERQTRLTAAHGENFGPAAPQRRP